MPLAYRICSARYPVLDGTGAAMSGARWNSPGRPVIYTSEHYATTILEQLVHVGRLLVPPGHHGAVIEIPDELLVATFVPAEHPGWDAPDSAVAVAVGDAWLQGGATPLLRVPSLPGQPVEWNLLINPLHAAFTRIRTGVAFSVRWDGRLFGMAVG
ncbi:MAG: RES domain-containing protein [Gemmatimonadales bacterium]|nr:RES domain-containing protein [Gemmatimonadota bacterium]MBP6443476.1 RES domain-containing protein [Gemmatimonadales bacterium]MBP6571158.1 RES domain-containing protein [Gemmatimonadales bacterium]MBP7619642.1 RES domain-containing protein [Gemmatimonadales bacterium]MBP9896890.1 RES domain-containing protein [Gemmatimonadales bacterium]